jgi:ribose transport system permease protein
MGRKWSAQIRIAAAPLTGVFSQAVARGLLGLLLLLAIGAVFAPRTISLSAWVAMMRFIAILGFAAIGQHLVIQQRGFNLSVAGAMSVAFVLVTALPSRSQGGLPVFASVALAILAGIISGALAGLAVTLLRIAPIVATTGVNALLLGAALRLSHGGATSAPPSLIDFAYSNVLGAPTIFLLLVGVTAATSFVLSRTTIGRRFVAAGTNAASANILAIPVNLYRTITYAIAGLFFAIAGVMLAGVLNTITVFAGNPYMLTTVAAFVVGGNTFGDTRCSVVATIVGVVFLTYLDQVLVSLSIPQSAQSIIQAGIVFAGVALPEFAQRGRA